MNRPPLSLPRSKALSSSSQNPLRGDSPLESRSPDKPLPPKPPLSKRAKQHSSRESSPRCLILPDISKRRSSHSTSRRTPSPLSATYSRCDSSTKQDRVEMLEDLIDSLDSVSTEDLKEKLNAPRDIFAMGKKEIRSISATRIQDIRQELEHQSKHKLEQFRKDVLTAKGVQKILKLKFR